MSTFEITVIAYPEIPKSITPATGTGNSATRVNFFISWGQLWK